jgi:hypothetical protein
LRTRRGGFPHIQEAIVATEIKKLEQLFEDTLKDVYFAEQKIVEVLPKMRKRL